MKILHVITALNYGGAEAMLAKLLAQNGATPGAPQSIVLSLMPPGRVGRKMIDDGVPVESLGVEHVWQVPRAIGTLAAALRRHRPDIVQGWMYHGNIVAAAGLAVARGPSLLMWNIRHSLNQLNRESLSMRTAIGLGAQFAHRPDATIYNSEAAMRQHEAYGYACRNAMVIPNGFDHGKFRPDASDLPVRQKLLGMFGVDPASIIVALVARHHPMKDHATAIEAVGMARQMGHNLHLLLAGRGTDALPPELVRACERCLPGDRVSLLGDRQDIADWLPGCDIALLSSAWGEGFPNILGEAMASGVPCLATDVGDSRAIMGDGGICVPSSNPAAMAAALAKLAMMGAEGRKCIGARGRERVEKQYSLPAIAARYTRLYAEALCGPRPSPASGEGAICAE